MFTGFASENTPAIQVWDFFRTFASTSAVRSVSLADDCAPIQYFRTGATSTPIRVYLPSAPIEGKQIKIVNSNFGSSSQLINIYSSDANDSGTVSPISSLGQGQTLDFCYSKNFISYGATVGITATGWITLNQSPNVSSNYLSVVSGGYGNTAGGFYSFVGSGVSNSTTSNYTSVLGGVNNTATANYACVAGGTSNSASGANTFIAGGSTNSASAQNSVIVGGNNNTADSKNSGLLAGSYGRSRSIIGNTVLPANDAPIANVSGVSQSALLVLGVATTDATATVLRSNTSAASTTNQVILPNNSAYVFQGTCIANVTGGSTTSGWKYEGVIKRGANAASTTLVAAVTPIVIAQDVAAATWVLAITADTTNGGIAVTVTGAAATTIRWVSRIETTEVTF